MSKPYSTDLRMRIVQAYLKGEGTQSQLGERFNVSPRAIGRLVRRFQETGSYDPLPHSGGNPTQKLFDHHWEVVEGWLEEDPLLTRVQLSHRILDHFGLTIDPTQVGRILRRRGITRKKKHPATSK